MDQQYLSPERLEALKQELNELKTAKRIEVADRLKRAKELGDLSENSEYFEAREEQAQVEARIFELEDIIKNASVISKTTSRTKVEVGSTIDVAKDGKKMTYTIVGSNEAEPEAGRISNESPLGKAFLGREPGESVNVKTPKGEVVYKILKIE